MNEWPLGTVTVVGACILDVLGRPVEAIPPGQGSARLTEIKATAAGTAAGAAVDLAKLGARVRIIGALGDDLLGDLVTAALSRHGVETASLVRYKNVQTSATILPIRPNGERPALHVPGATRLFTRADIKPQHLEHTRALLIGAPDALAGLTAEDLADVAITARNHQALVAVDVLHPGRPEDLRKLAPLLACTDWFLPNADQLLNLTGTTSLPAAINDILTLGTKGVAVTQGADGCLLATQQSPAPERLPAIATDVVDTTGCGDGFNAGMLAGLLLNATAQDAAWLGIACGSLVATGLGSDAGIESLDQALDFLSRQQPAAAGRIKELIT